MIGKKYTQYIYKNDSNLIMKYNLVIDAKIMLTARCFYRADDAFLDIFDLLLSAMVKLTFISTSFA